MTDEQSGEVSRADMKAHFAPKKSPPKLYIPSRIVRHFVETRAKPVELATDYDRSLGQSSRADFERKYGSRPLKGKTIAQLKEQENQSLPPLVVHSYDDPETAELIKRTTKELGASVQYESYFPTAELTYKYTYGQPLVRSD